MSESQFTPAGATFNGRSEIIKGRAVLMFTDTQTGGTFTVPENATAPDIEAEHRRCRQRFMSAGAAFAPVV